MFACNLSECFLVTMIVTVLSLIFLYKMSCTVFFMCVDKKKNIVVPVDVSWAES